ncbi:MAG: sulfite exporter TauE/SafE family protein [Clostridia bacterium]|nr:sulfite exporter TauE/SafE family protein [Clostridia bacterium]
MGMLYLLVALIATIIGGMTGIGGGVIIKPVLDAFSTYDVSSINILSSVTIFSMAAVSFTQNSINGFKLSKNLVFLAVGSIIGGLLGKELLFFVTATMISRNIVIMQSGILALLLVVVLFKSRIRSHYVKNVFVIILVGIFLGTTSSFLGVGGGPINVFVLHLFLEMDTKQLTVSSIFVILLSQFSKLSAITFTSGFSSFHLEMLVYMIPGGIAGGLLGTFLLKKTHVNHIKKVFNLVVGIIILLNIFNIIRAI